jgi:dTMP kinase
VSGSRTGCFISLEGVDGAGKSTHVPWLVDLIEAHGHPVVATPEPGGTPLGEALRALLLQEPMSHESEALLMFAARREHLELVIRPALAAGRWVVCDRFADATFAYQGGGHGVPLARLQALEAWLLRGAMPDRTFLFDVPVAIARERRGGAAAGHAGDKFEREDAAFFERVRAAYLDRASAAPERFRVLDASGPLDATRAQLRRHLAELLAGWPPEPSVRREDR